MNYIVNPSEDGKTIKDILRGPMRISSALMRRAKNEGHILLNGEDKFVTAVVQAGDLITFDVPEIPCSVLPSEGNIELIYSDDQFFALSKPAGMFTHPTGNVNTGTLLNLALTVDSSARAVNRLDRDTSGVVLFARGAWAASLASSLSFDKEYTALVFGVPPEGEIDLPIAREAPHALRRIISPDGSPSLTRIAVQASCGSFSVVRLQPVTGRTHQLRVHCLALGSPILGDRLYNSPESVALSLSLGIDTQALHAGRLSFVHPLSGVCVDIFAEPERDFFEKVQIMA